MTPHIQDLVLTEIFSEEVLILRAKRDQDVMLVVLEKFSGIVRSSAKNYFLTGADRDDIMQEGMLGLFKAVRDFNPQKSQFRGFAQMCVTRQIITAVKTSTRQKHHPLNRAISVDKLLDGEDRTLLDTIADTSAVDPAAHLERDEMTQDVRARIFGQLSSLEQTVLYHQMAGRSYVEIAKVMGRGVKSIDNALQRSKRKIQQSLTEALA